MHICREFIEHLQDKLDRYKEKDCLFSFLLNFLH